ncbi:hypothetical protein JMJ77_0001976, partial [Colletotrichum scovillei]
MPVNPKSTSQPPFFHLISSPSSSKSMTCEDIHPTYLE